MHKCLLVSAWLACACDGRRVQSSAHHSPIVGKLAGASHSAVNPAAAFTHSSLGAGMMRAPSGGRLVVGKEMLLSSRVKASRVGRILASEDDDSSDEDDDSSDEEYRGPICRNLTNVVERIEVKDINSPVYGLVLEVADSLIENAGRGLFVRCAKGVQDVTMEAGTVFSGYAAGAMKKASVEELDQVGKTCTFAIGELDTAVWFEKDLHAVGLLLQTPGIENIAGHKTVRQPFTGRVTEFGPDDNFKGPCDYVVDASQPSPMTIKTVGHMANDFAYGQRIIRGDNGDDGTDDDDYYGRSATSNILIPVQGLERDPEDSTMLRPTEPFLVVMRKVIFRNRKPMELGCEYGHDFWEGEEQEHD